jgi:murein DD-endopeptidase MepM/ murein hydrolase activator NlpD
MLGQRYAYDFLRSSKNGSFRHYRGSPWELWTIGVPVERCYGYDKPVHAPADGTVLRVRNDLGERKRLHAIVDTLRLLKRSVSFDIEKADIDELTGNFIMIRHERAISLLAHLRTGSVLVHPGDLVVAGQEIGRVGHTGNTTAPHLHFQLMDVEDPRAAQGIPCAFERYEEQQQSGAWDEVRGGMPRRAMRIRFEG